MIVIPSESIFDVLVGANVHFSDNIEVKFSIMSLVGRFAGVFLAITAVGTAAGVYYVHVDAQNQQQVRLFVFCIALFDTQAMISCGTFCDFSPNAIWTEKSPSYVAKIAEPFRPFSVF
jgi:hypothetical protein